MARKIVLLFFVLIAVTIFLMQPLLPSSSARPQETERVFDNTIPKNVPLKVRIKKEKEPAFKDMKNEKWVRELEVEVTNTGDKPIYFLFMLLRTNVDAGIGALLDDVPGMRPGSRLCLSVGYGRSELGDLISKPGPDDVPIRPGETYTFTIHPGEVGGVGDGHT